MRSGVAPQVLAAIRNAVVHLLEGVEAAWPGIQQVFQIHRVRELPGKTEQETVYGITSLTEQEAGPERLLALARGHWGIENRLPGVRDVTLGEDACRVRSGVAPQVLAAMRNAVVHLLEGVEAASKAAALRRFAIYPLEALALIIPEPDN